MPLNRAKQVLVPARRALAQSVVPELPAPGSAEHRLLVTRTSARLRILRGKPDADAVLAWELCRGLPDGIRFRDPP
jgi:hypothetical protein